MIKITIVNHESYQKTSLGAGHMSRDIASTDAKRLGRWRQSRQYRLLETFLQTFFRGVSDQLSPEEIRHAVWSIKNNFRGKFEDQGEQDLYSCLQLFAKQGLASEDNLTLLEGFLSPKASNKESLKEKNQQFKENRQQEVSPGKEESGLTGRERDLEKVMAMLITGSSRVVNLHGISGVFKTKLAIETILKWSGKTRNERRSFSCFKRFSTRQNDHKFRSKSSG